VDVDKKAMLQNILVRADSAVEVLYLLIWYCSWSLQSRAEEGLREAREGKEEQNVSRVSRDFPSSGHCLVTSLIPTMYAACMAHTGQATGVGTRPSFSMAGQQVWL